MKSQPSKITHVCLTITQPERIESTCAFYNATQNCTRLLQFMGEYSRSQQWRSQGSIDGRVLIVGHARAGDGGGGGGSSPEPFREPCISFCCKKICSDAQLSS